LQKNPNISRIIENGIAVICICEKRIALKLQYNETYLNSHINGPECNRSTRTHAITEFLF
ncbi:7068_t:CDS:1, partial [Racocetra persica]